MPPSARSRACSTESARAIPYRPLLLLWRQRIRSIEHDSPFAILISFPDAYEITLLHHCCGCGLRVVFPQLVTAVGITQIVRLGAIHMNRLPRHRHLFGCEERADRIFFRQREDTVAMQARLVGHKAEIGFGETIGLRGL